MKNAIPIYIGFDSTQRIASQVCEFSILKRTSIPVMTQHLALGGVMRNGMYARPSWIENGQRHDFRDGKPFSTDFSFSRFLVPHLSMFDGWAIFCDGDFLFLDDIAELVSQADPKYAAMVVKHKHNPANEPKRKMDGRLQTAYRRKNWSSLVLWNCSHPAHRDLTIDAVNRESGQWLHAFSWLNDEQIGELPARWNHLVGVNEPIDNPAGVHFTLGGPWLEQHSKTPFANEWREEHRSYWNAHYPGVQPEVFAAA